MPSKAFKSREWRSFRICIISRIFSTSTVYSTWEAKCVDDDMKYLRLHRKFECFKILFLWDFNFFCLPNLISLISVVIKYKNSFEIIFFYRIYFIFNCNLIMFMTELSSCRNEFYCFSSQIFMGTCNCATLYCG